MKKLKGNCVTKFSSELTSFAVFETIVVAITDLTCSQQWKVVSNSIEAYSDLYKFGVNE